MSYSTEQLLAPRTHAEQLITAAYQYGTPLYIYDGNVIQEQYRRLSRAFAGFPHRIHYALKANSNINILRLLQREGAGLDAVSLPEVELGLRAGFAPEDILFTPNCVAIEEIEQAVSYGVRINIDNLEILEQFGNRYGASVPVCLRLNPHIYGGGNSHIQTGHIDSKFGISIHQMRHVLRIVRSYNIPVAGLHMHTGSDILDADVFLQAAEVLLNAAFEFENLEYLDFGSGFKVAYRDDDITTDIEELGQKMADRLADFYQEYGRQLTIWFEPGKYLVSEAGFLVTRVNVVKHTVANVFAGVDSGLNHLIRPMMYDAYHRILNLTNPDGSPRIYSVVGYICETDTFAQDRKLPEIRSGDLLAICNAGAYCMSMASNYNCRYRPAEVLLLDGAAHLIRQEEGLEQLLQNQIEIEL